MKVLALLLVCAVAVHGRSTAVEPVKSRSLAALGDAPYLVHLRVAVSTSGFLESGIGSLISESWVLTAANAVQDARFIWIRYGAVTVINPQLVTEASITQANGNIALININRHVEPTANIAPVSLGGSIEELSSVGIYRYGAEETGAPGEQLISETITLEVADDDSLITNDPLSKFDVGAPLVVDGAQIAVLVKVEDGSSVFEKLDANLDWINEVAGL